MPPRVLVVMPDQWSRAFLRAALREVGYDAVGTRSLTAALRMPPVELTRAPVRSIIVGQDALREPNEPALSQLFARYGAPATMLLARATVAAPAGEWQRVLQRPVSVADIVAEVETLLPLPPEARLALD